jgi:hypothetical protein
MNKPKRTGGKKTGSKRTEIKFRDISNVSGTVSIVGGDSITDQSTTGLSAAEVSKLFGQIYTTIDSRANTPAGNKEDLKSDVREIQSAVTAAAQKKEDVDEGFVLRRFRNIARMAPDLLDVVVATLANPLAGLGVAVKKMADKAKEETKQA